MAVARRARSPLRGLLLLGACAPLFFAPLPAFAQDEPAPQTVIPSFAELEAAGAVIGEIRIDARNIFDPEEDEKEDKYLFRLANTLHIRTRPQVIERQLLFKPGERVSQRLIEETERLLRANRYLYDVSIRPVAYRGGIVDIEVRTRDTWTFAPGISFSRTGGSNTRGATLKEYNALGTGVYVGITRSSDVDRTGTEYRITQNHAFGSWATIDYAVTHMDDGKRESFAVTKPFYALDARTAGGFTASKDDRIESQYLGGALASQFRHRSENAEVYGGWSRGLIDGWARRYSVGVSHEANRYSLEPDRLAPALLPPDQTFVSPFFRYEVVEDDYEKVTNRDLIARPEFFAMGVRTRLQLGRALEGLGSTRGLWLYSAEASDGFKVLDGQALLASVSASGRHSEDGGIEQQRLGGSLRYYSRKREHEHSLFFALLNVDIARDPDVSDQLLLGGDVGMRGYPLRYQSGNRRAVLTVEQRGYTDLYVYQLFRIGGAIFWDTGRAWGGQSPNAVQPGWLSDIGFGLRILSARTAFGNVLHADFAFPLTRDPNIRRFQFSLDVKTSF